MSGRGSFQPVRWSIGGGRTLSNEDHTLVMGVLNVTPDSFSDGGRFFDSDAAIAHGRRLFEHGADIVDVGGESTRPGSSAVSVEEELERVLPVVEALARDGLVSIDTSKAPVAAAAIAAGAVVVNDVTALNDLGMAALAAESGVGMVLMHMLGEPRTMQENPRYDDVVVDVRDHLVERASVAQEAGVDRSAICLDPGIGFGKALDHNLALLGPGVQALAAEGWPVLVGASRKSFIAKILPGLLVEERDGATIAAHVLAISAGAAMIRSHNVVMALRSARVADAIVRAAST